MSELIDGLGIPFEFFDHFAAPRYGQGMALLSYISNEGSYSVSLYGKVKKEVPERLHHQSFNENYLLPIAADLGVSLSKAAKLIALRNAWIAHFQEYEISPHTQRTCNDLVGQIGTCVQFYRIEILSQ